MSAPLPADLVTRLRHWSREDDLDIGREAADEIVRLQREVAHLRKTCADFGVSPARVPDDVGAPK